MPPIVRTPDPKARKWLWVRARWQKYRIKDFAHRTISNKAQLQDKLKALCDRLRMDLHTELSLLGEAKQMRLKSQDGSFDRNHVDGEAGTLEQKVFYS